jgi:hypothetical protein
MRAEPRVRKTNQAGETEQRRRGESPERMHAHEQGDARSANGRAILATVAIISPAAAAATPVSMRRSDGRSP